MFFSDETRPYIVRLVRVFADRRRRFCRGFFFLIRTDVLRRENRFVDCRLFFIFLYFFRTKIVRNLSVPISVLAEAKKPKESRVVKQQSRVKTLSIFTDGNAVVCGYGSLRNKSLSHSSVRIFPRLNSYARFFFLPNCRSFLFQ